MSVFTKEQLRPLEEILAYNCAPTFAKVKPASIITVLKKDFPSDAHEVVAYYESFLINQGLRMEIMCERPNSFLLMIYCPELLAKSLQKPEVQAYLAQEAGYPLDVQLDAQIAFLAHRLQSQGSFPHEIGLFLGYPLADVQGFIQNKGQNFKTSGYWKVYGDETVTSQLFSAYNFCRQIFVEKFNTGFSVQQIIAGTI